MMLAKSNPRDDSTHYDAELMMWTEYRWSPPSECTMKNVLNGRVINF